MFSAIRMTALSAVLAATAATLAATSDGQQIGKGVTLVFPISAREKAASAEGVFEKIAPTDAVGRKAATEQAAGSSNPSAFTTYHVTATGALIK